jgi:hypothetical protein
MENPPFVALRGAPNWREEVDRDGFGEKQSLTRGGARQTTAFFPGALGTALCR